MTVQELIEELKHFPPDTEVIMFDTVMGPHGTYVKNNEFIQIETYRRTASMLPDVIRLVPGSPTSDKKI